MAVPAASSLFRIANVVMGLLFVACIGVQYNDPDPVRWMTIYGLAAAASFLAGRTSFARPLAAITGAAALLWAAVLARVVFAQGWTGALFGSRGMLDPGVEEARELLGLALVAGWMAVVAVAGATRATAGGRSRSMPYVPPDTRV